MNAFAVLCLLAAGGLSVIDDGLQPRIFGAVMFFGAGMAVS